MGSSASIAAHATLTAAKSRKPKITFHYEKPPNVEPPMPEEPEKPDTSPTPPVKVEDSAAVTRYFPLVKPVQSPVLELPPPPPPSETPTSLAIPPQVTTTTDRQEQKQMKENYHYVCTVCSKCFMFKGCLTRHMARHSGVVTTTPSPPEESKPAITVATLTSPTEVRYKLKDPRLYEQLQSKESSDNPRKAPRPFRNRPTPTLSPIPLKTQQPTPRSKCGGTRSSTEIVLSRNVLAICSCLKCNSSFDDVDKLKEHIPRCQGYNAVSSRRSSAARGNATVGMQKECNVR